MISKKSTFFLGFFIFLIPFFGLPSSYKNTFVIISGILLILLSLKISIPKKNIKAKTKREKVTAVYSESRPLEPKISPIQMREIKSKEPVGKSSE
ncbi:MAG: hypothetical protein V4690_03510 [Patescibacteria group bacterium]